MITKSMVGIVGLVGSALLGAPAAAAGPDVTSEVCTAWNLGESQEQIYEQLQRNDHRITPQDAWSKTNWAILDGDCDQ